MTRRRTIGSPVYEEPGRAAPTARDTRAGRLGRDDCQGIYAALEWAAGSFTQDEYRHCCYHGMVMTIVPEVMVGVLTRCEFKLDKKIP